MAFFIYPNTFWELQNFMFLGKKILGTFGDAIRMQQCGDAMDSWPYFYLGDLCESFRE
jgi:hypothetical protein